MATHLRLHPVGIVLSSLYQFSLLASYLCHFCHGLYGLTKHLAAGQTVARRGSRVGHLRGRFRFSLLSEERKPKDFQHSVRLTKSCNIPSSQECNEVEPVPAVEGCREKRVLYLTGCKCSINSFQMMMLFLSVSVSSVCGVNFSV